MEEQLKSRGKSSLVELDFPEPTLKNEAPKQDANLELKIP